MFTVTALLVAAAFFCTLSNANGRCPIWVPVLLLVIVEMVRLVPVK